MYWSPSTMSMATIRPSRTVYALARVISTGASPRKRSRTVRAVMPASTPATERYSGASGAGVRPRIIRGVELCLEDVALARGSRTVGRGISLVLRGGELTALAGPSGIGKTSLLRAIVRLDEPAAGRVDVDGRDARELDPRELRRRVGFVAQAPAMLPGTVRENLAYALPAPLEQALRGALAATGLDPGFMDRDASRLSGGEQARVAIARALTRDPGVLLLDEPTASLDPGATAAVECLLRDLAGRGLALLVVTHDAAQAERIADHTVRL